MMGGVNIIKVLMSHCKYCFNAPQVTEIISICLTAERQKEKEKKRSIYTMTLSRTRHSQPFIYPWSCIYTCADLWHY